MDGARFANALAHLGCTPAELTWQAGVDVLSFGGTKNGCLGVEAVVLFDPARAWEFELRRKRGGHLFSKHRFLRGADGGVSRRRALARAGASAANARAARAGRRDRRGCPGRGSCIPIEANAVFAAWPRAGHRAAKAAGAQYYLWPGNQSLEGPDDEPVSARLVCNWSTTEAEVAALVGVLEGREAADVKGLRGSASPRTHMEPVWNAYGYQNSRD